MNILKQLIGLWRRQDVVPLTLNEKAMWLEILKYVNLNDREQPVQISAMQMMAGTQIPKGSLDKTRKGLVRKGYLEVEKGRKGHAPKYRLVPLYNYEIPISSSIGSSMCSSIGSTNGSAIGSSMSSALSSTSKKIKIKKKENIKENTKRKDLASRVPSVEEVREYILNHKLMVDPDIFWDCYAGAGWRDRNGNPVLDWRAKARQWHRRNDRASKEDVRKVMHPGKTELEADRIYFGEEEDDMIPELKEEWERRFSNDK